MVDIKVVPTPDKVTEGQDFVVGVSVKPDNTGVAGLQLNFSFNPECMRVNSVAQGNFLGNSSWFNAGTINNTAGLVKDIYGACLGAGNQATAEGVFAIINCTALKAGADSSLSLANVIVGSKEGQPLPFDLFITQVVVLTVYDLNGDGLVDTADLVIASLQFGGPGSADFDHNGIVNILDMIMLGQNLT